MFCLAPPQVLGIFPCHSHIHESWSDSKVKSRKKKNIKDSWMVGGSEGIRKERIIEDIVEGMRVQDRVVR